MKDCYKAKASLNNGLKKACTNILLLRKTPCQTGVVPIGSYEPRVVQVRRDLSSSVVQPPDEARLSHELKPCAWPFSRQVLKTSKDGGCTTTLGSLCYYPTVFTVKRYFQYEHLLFQLGPVVSCPPPCTIVKAMAPSSQ